jgi:hypothetical protein
MRCWFLVGVAILMVPPAMATEDCANELRMFQRDVRAAREMKERVLWRLVGANYRRRVTRYCAKEERRAGVAKLQLTPDEMKLLGLPDE